MRTARITQELRHLVKTQKNETQQIFREFFSCCVPFFDSFLSSVSSSTNTQPSRSQHELSYMVFACCSVTMRLIYGTNKSSLKFQFSFFSFFSLCCHSIFCYSEHSFSSWDFGGKREQFAYEQKPDDRIYWDLNIFHRQFHLVCDQLKPFFWF